jgi:hypothetical protein
MGALSYPHIHRSYYNPFYSFSLFPFLAVLKPLPDKPFSGLWWKDLWLQVEGFMVTGGRIYGYRWKDLWC